MSLSKRIRGTISHEPQPIKVIKMDLKETKLECLRLTAGLSLLPHDAVEVAKAFFDFIWTYQPSLNQPDSLPGCALPPKPPRMCPECTSSPQSRG